MYSCQFQSSIVRLALGKVTPEFEWRQLQSRSLLALNLRSALRFARNRRASAMTSAEPPKAAELR